MQIIVERLCTAIRPDEGSGEAPLLPCLERFRIPEVKGFEDEQARPMDKAAKRWCDAVFVWGEMGEWKFDVCKDPKKLNDILS